MPFSAIARSVLLLWLAGIGLRLTVLAVPPVIPQIHADLGLTETEVGVLTGIPQVLFALAAVGGSLLIARFGAVGTLIAGLVVCAAGSALRGAADGVPLLYTATVAMALGIAVMQPSLPPLTRQWLPDRVGFATAVYSNGLLVGEILPVVFGTTLVLPLVGGSWRLSFVVWGAATALLAIIVVMFVPRGQAQVENAAAAGGRWWPDWRDPTVWRLGLMMGSITSMYFACNGFIPEYLNHIGHPDLIAGALTALNLGQLPASFVLLAVASRIERRAWPYVACAVLCLVGVLGIVLTTGVWIIAAAGLLGFAAAAALVLLLALPPLLSAPNDIHRLSAAMFTLGYGCAVIVPIISGLAWDLSERPALAFLPIGACPFMLIALAATLRFAPARSARAGETV